MFADPTKYGDEIELVVSGEQLKAQKILSIVFKVNNVTTSTINIPNHILEDVNITCGNATVKTITLSDGTFTITSNGELSFKFNKNYLITKSATAGTVESGSLVQNALNPSLSNYAWYKYNLMGYDDWGCWPSQEMADAAKAYYGDNINDNINWSRFTWKESYKSMDGNTIFNMNPYGASAVRGGKGFGTHQVGLKLPNYAGLYDMSGNVSEWCDDSEGNQVMGGSFANNPQKIYVNAWVSDGNGDNFFAGMRVVTPSNVSLTDYEKLAKVGDLYFGKYEVTKELWASVMDGNSEGVSTAPSKSVAGGVFKADQTLITGFDEDGKPITESIDWTYGNPSDLGEITGLCPVENITKFDAMYFCNLYSAAKSLTAYYTLTDIVVENEHITSATVVKNASATGFRLPTQAEWIAAATDSNQDYAGCNKAGTTVRIYPYYDMSQVPADVTLTATITDKDGNVKTVEKTLTFTE